MTPPPLTLRDLDEGDRAAFVAYQLDPRYRALYGLAEDPGPAHGLFDLFRRWQSEVPRHNLQLGVFDAAGRLCGCAGLRARPDRPGTATLGIELAPECWGRHRMAVDALAALLHHGFVVLGLDAVVGETSTGNRRVERLARWFGGQETARRDGPEWMRVRGWQEAEWTITRDAWAAANRGTRACVVVWAANDAALG